MERRRLSVRTDYRAASWALALACTALAAYGADSRPVLRAVRVEDPPEIDGRLDDPAWRKAPRGGPLVQVVPDEGAEPSERTEFAVVYDDRALYIAVWCYDRHPEAILAREMARDGRLTADDYVTVVLDTFRDRRNGYLFRVNPNGAREDFLITANTDLNESWDGVWRAAAVIDGEGWKAEIEIPFSTIAFDPKLTTWGFNIERNIKRRYERDRWAGAVQDARVYNVSEAGDLTGLEGLRQGLGLEFVPYVLGRYGEDRTADDRDWEADAGGEVRYRITPNLSASVSYNTDFAETEVDARRINLTRFPLFFPEKRDFFLEDAGIFQFGRLGTELIPLFTRRIGLSPEGEPVPIVVAGKLTGRVNSYNLGFLDALVDAPGDLGLRNAAAARVSKNIFEQSTAGVLLTYGDPQSENENFVGGADLGIRRTDFLGDQILEAGAFVLGSVTEDAPGAKTFAYGGSIELPNDLYRAEIQFLEIQENFEAALGFVPRRGIRAYESSFAYRPRPENLDAVRQLFFIYANSHVTDLNDGDDLDTAGHALYPFWALFESGDELFVSVRYELDSPDEDFEISEGVVIPPGDYWWPSYRVGIDTASKRPVEADFTYTFGGFYDGDADRYAAGLRFRPFRGVSLRLEYELDDVRLPEGDFATRLGSVDLRLSFTPDLHWFHLVQYDSVSDTIGYQMRVRWEWRPGAELFFVLGQNTARNHGRLRALATEATLKAVVRFRF